MNVSGEQEYSLEVTAPVAVCFHTITQFERYPSWFTGINSARIVSRYPSGVGHQIEFKISIPLKTIRYVLEYTYEEPERLQWKSVDGDVEAIAGSYLFEPVDTSITRVTCRQAIDLGFWVPGPIRMLLERTALQQSVHEFKTAAEHAATAAQPKVKRKSKKSIPA